MSFNEETINRWLDTGILDGVPDDKVDVVVKSCEDLFDYFMSHVGVVEYPENLDTWCFPMLRKILEKIDYNEINVRQLVLFSVKTMKSIEYQTVKSQLTQVGVIDTEVHLVNYIVDEYIKEYHGGDM